MRSKKDLHPYQEAAISHVIKNPAAGLFLDMGLGKTAATLTAIQELLYDRFEVSRVLVIAPKRVARDTWTDEIAAWDHLADLTTSRIMGTAAQRLAAIKTPADIHLINRENVPWLVTQMARTWPWDLVVIDELSSFKSPSAKRFRALRKVRGKISRVIGLTGTPAPNGLLDLWSQVYLLDQGARLGLTLGEYRKDFFFPAATYGMIVTKYGLRRGAEAQIHERIGDICISMKASDHLDLPGRLDQVYPVRLGDELTEHYRKFEEDCVMEVEGEEITGVNALAMSTKLLQFTSGAIYTDLGGWGRIHDHKLDALEDIYEAALGSPVLVFYQYRHELERIQERFPGARVMDSAQDVKDWNTGEVPLMVAHPASAGHGLNLQAGGHRIVWFTLPRSLELYEQAIHRLDRQGQTRVVVNQILMTRGTVEDDLALALTAKTRTQERLMEAVKARLKRVKDEA